MFRITPMGMRETLFAFLFCGGAIALLLLLSHAWQRPELSWWAFLPAALLLFVCYFFRDPVRVPPENPNALVSPADGRVTHIEEVEAPEFLGGKALRISIFLSIFDVHLNRAPFAGRATHKLYKKGEFLNAMSADSGHRNEMHDVGFTCDDPRLPKFLVRQIAGLIARRIVCLLEDGQAVERGERIGMIKFGSRTDLFLPAGTAIDIQLRVGQTVRAGATVLGVLRG